MSDSSEERVNQKSNPQWDLGKNMYLFCGERKKVISFPCAEPAQFDTVSLLFHYFSCELIMGQRIGLNCCLQPNNSAPVSSVAEVPFDFNVLHSYPTIYKYNLTLNT